MAAVIRAEGLTRRRGDLRAAEGLGIEVEVGETSACPVPNGAGQATTIPMLTAMLQLATAGPCWAV